MDNRLAARLYDAIELVSGIAPSRTRHQLEGSQWLDRDAIERLQRERLATLLELARQHAPHFRELAPDAIRAVDGRSPAAVLRTLPILTKETLRRRPDSLRTGLGRRNLRLATSGSTGEPLSLEVDRPAFARAFAAKQRALAWYGVRFSDRQLRIWGRTTHPVGRAWWALRDRLQNRLRVTTVDLSDETLERVCSRLQRFRPTYVNGYSSGIHRLAQFILAHAIETAPWKTRLVLATSEMLFPWQRDEVESAFGAPVAGEYGCGEVHAIGYDCPHGRMHVSHENVVLELLDDGGEPVPPGVSGRVTVTSLLNRATALVRYQNGDLAEWSPDGDCPCGRQPGLPTLRSVTGRTADRVLRTDGSPSHWGALFYAFKESFPPGSVEEHFARQTALDRLEIELVPGDAFDPRVEHDLAERLRAALGDDLTVELRLVEAIERSAGGKLRYFESTVAPSHPAGIDDA